MSGNCHQLDHSGKYLVLVSVDGGVADGAAESGGRTRRPDVARRRRVLARQAKVQHVDAPARVLHSTHREIRLASAEKKQKNYLKKRINNSSSPDRGVRCKTYR